MRIKATYKLTNLCIIAAFGICGLVACNGSDDSKTASTVTPADSSANTSATTDSTAKDTTAMAAKPARKKGKASITIPSAGTDKITKDKDGVYNRAEIMPEFPGGQNALSNYISSHVDYGQNAIENNTAGTLTISFVVDEDGKVTHVHLTSTKKLGDGLDEQATKAISDMPAWTPGKVKGKNVKTRLELPIAFELEG